jgi:glycosyltransferase involved in cell wall biosynthesis
MEVGLPRSFTDFQILCVTRITPRKGIRYLIEAFSRLSKKYPNLNLQIVGEGNEKNNLEKLVRKLGIEKQINFIGLLPHEKLPAYYQSACVYVLPSQNEGMSNSMLEALSSGLPLLATDTGGTQELIENGVNGFVLKMKSAQDIAEKLEILIKNEELRKSMGVASRIKAEGMSWEKIAEKYIDTIKKIIRIN